MPLKRLLTVITRAIGAQYGSPSRIDTFTAFLHDVVELSGSLYGCISEIIYNEEAISQRLLTSANASSSTPSTEESLQIHHLQQLGQQAIATSVWLGGVSQIGGSAVTYTLLPLHHGGKHVGVLALAGCEDGYNDESRAYLEPVAAAAGSLIASRQDQIENTAISAELHRVDALYQQIVQRLPDIITILDGEGHWRYSSPAGTHLLGYPPGYDPSGGVFSLMHEDDVALAMTAFQEVLDGTRTVSQPIDLRLRDIHGEYRIFETTGDSLLTDPHINGVLFTSKDVTEHRNTTKALHQHDAQLGALIETIQAGILLLSSDHQILHANSTFREMFKYSGDTPLTIGANSFTTAQHFLDQFVDPERLILKTFEIEATNTSLRGEVFELVDGRSVTLDYISTKSADGEWFRVSVWRDTTHQTAVDRHKESVLEHERLVRRAIERQNKDLIAFNATKDQFVADVSHELRTPLTSIIGYTELLLLDADQLDSMHLEYIEMLHQNGKHLLDLVGNLLLVTRLDAGRVELNRNDENLSTLVSDIVGAFRPEAEAKLLTLTSELSASTATVSVDRGKLEQVLRNLIANALKFTPDGGTVNVSTRRDGHVWTASVSDTGIGIREDDLERVFERFHTGAPVRDDEISGSGLGLTITKAIVELHGGTLTVESNSGGSTFTVELPDPSGSTSIWSST